MKRHISHDSYLKRELNFPFFTMIESIATKNNDKNFLKKGCEKLTNIIFANRENKNDNAKEDKNEEGHLKKQIKDMMNKYQENLKKLNELNYLNLNKNYKI